MSARYMFRLNEDQDKDLGDWLDSLRKGERSFWIREALRKALVEIKPVGKPNQVDARRIPKIKGPSLTIPGSEKAEVKLDKLANQF